MSIKASIVVGNRFLGEFEPELTWDSALAEGQAFFCPRCCEVWAVLRVEGRVTIPVTAYCTKHHYWRHMPGGSVWLHNQPWFSDHFPREVLLYEMLNLLTLAEHHPQHFALPPVSG